MTEYTIFVKAPSDAKGKPAWLNSNQRPHWAAKAQRTRTWRQLALITARIAKLPKGLSKVHIVGYVNKTNNRSYDAGNLSPTLKPIVDGLIDYGLLPDDNNDHLIGPDIRPGEKQDQAGVTITIKETT